MEIRRNTILVIKIIGQEYWKLLKYVLPRFGLILISLIICVGLTELGFRLTGHFRDIDFTLFFKELTNSERLPQGLLSDDTTFKVKLVPNTKVLADTSDFSVIYKTNSRGLRDQEYSYEKPENISRILAFGDSFTFGEGVPYGQRYTEIIEQQTPNTEVVNFGIPGFGTDQALLYYYLEGQNYQADTVILFINLVDISRARLGLARNGEIDLTEYDNSEIVHNVRTKYLKQSDEHYQQKLPPVLNKSFAYAYFQYKFSILKLNQQMADTDKNIWQEYKDNYQPPSTNEIELIRNRTKILVEEFQRLVANNNQKFVLVNIDIPQEINFLDQVPEHIILLDLSTDLEKLSLSQPLTFKYDQHYNPQTHKFIGEKVSQFLLVM